MNAQRDSLLWAAVRSPRAINRSWKIVVALITCLGGFCQLAGAPVAEMQTRDSWIQSRLLRADCADEQAGDARLFSFVYGGRTADKLLASWPRTSSVTPLSRDRTQHTLTWTDSATGLEVRCIAVTYADFPAVEWTVHFRNKGSVTTPVLERVQAIDTRIERTAAGEFLLKYQNGDTCAPDLYEPHEQVLASGSSLRFAPRGGRGTNFAFPYYNLVLPNSGLFLAVGWPGQWAAEFMRDTDRGLQIVAGQELTHLVLQPGEEIRTPLIALLFWQGDDTQQAQNLWRRWMIAHNLPRTADGQLPPPIMPGNTSLEFNEMVNANEENQKQFIDRYVQEQIKIDHWWMDAGWYPCDNWPKTGTWEPDLQRFPRGLRAISDHARQRGIKTLVWFEPERVAGGTWLSEKHPEWLLGATLLNLGNPEARDWLTNHVDRVLREQGIDLYRQDFNMDPLDFWRNNDAPDRQGATENFHIQGYLAYWDTLRERHPNLIIDSCASGGRRNDLETMRRAVALHPTDYNYSHLAAKQAFHHSLFQWLPYFGSNTLPIDTVDAYAIRSGHAMSVVLGYDLRRSDLDYELLRTLTAESRIAASYYYDDYYPLTPYSVAEDAWIAWQFHRPGNGAGIVEVFRRPRSNTPVMALKLRGLDPKSVYEIVDSSASDARRSSGRALMQDGLLVTLRLRRQAALITYQALDRLAAVITDAPAQCEVLELVQCSGTESFAPDQASLDYLWDFGDGTSATGSAVEHAYTQPGDYTIRLTVADQKNATDTTATVVSVKSLDTTPPAVTAVAAGASNCVEVVFSEPVQQASAATSANYAIDQGIEVLSARLAPDLVTVTLATSPLSIKAEYALSVAHVLDRARTPQPIAAGTQHSFQYDELYAWWKLNEAAGDVARDHSGNGHHGMLLGAHGGPRWVQSDRGAVLSFDGIDAHVEADTHFPQLQTPFTLALWVNPAATQMQHADILGNHGEPFMGISLQQDGNRTNCYGFGFGDGQKWQGTGAAQLEAERWQHLVVVCDGENSILYVDGVEQSRGPGRGPLVANVNQNLKLGQGYHTARYFQGLLKDVRIYRRALSATEISASAQQDNP